MMKKILFLALAILLIACTKERAYHPIEGKTFEVIRGNELLKLGDTVVFTDRDIYFNGMKSPYYIQSNQIKITAPMDKKCNATWWWYFEDGILKLNICLFERGEQAWLKMI